MRCRLDVIIVVQVVCRTLVCGVTRRCQRPTVCARCDTVSGCVCASRALGLTWHPPNWYGVVCRLHGLRSDEATTQTRLAIVAPHIRLVFCGHLRGACVPDQSCRIDTIFSYSAFSQNSAKCGLFLTSQRHAVRICTWSTATSTSKVAHPTTS